MTIDIRTSKADGERIIEITDRIVALAKQLGVACDPLTVQMDLSACHLNGNPLNLQRLLDAAEVDLAHDVFGIGRHLDRDTGRLGNCFRPRFSARHVA